jgi:hypothetical protein
MPRRVQRRKRPSDFHCSACPFPVKWPRTSFPLIRRENIMTFHPSHRRRFLERCGLLAAGTVGGFATALGLRSPEPALAQDKPPMHNAEEQLKKLKLSSSQSPC